MRPVPQGIDTDLRSFLVEMRDELRRVQYPQQPQRAYTVPTAGSLPPAASFPDCIALVTALNTLAESDATNWRRVDTGAIIA